MDGNLCWAGTEMKQIRAHSLVKTLHDFPKPDNDTIVRHVSFIGSVFLPVFNIDLLFSAEDHFKLVGFKDFQILIRNNLI